MFDWLILFFSNKEVFKDNAPFRFGTAHIVFIIAAIVTITFVTIFFRKISHKKLSFLLTTLWAVITVFEVIKLTWESISDGGFSFGALLPLYVCSMYMYMTPIAFLSKNPKVKRCACAFLFSFGTLGGFANFIFPQVLDGYPVLSFAGIHVLMYHYSMVLTGIWIVTSGFYKVKPLDFVRAFVPFLIYAVPVIVVDKIWMYNYGFFNSGGGTPFEIISSLVPSHWVWTFVMLFLYFVAAVLFFLPFIITFFVRKRKSGGNFKSQTAETTESV